MTPNEQALSDNMHRALGVPISCDVSDLSHVETPSQQQLNQAYAAMLEARIRHQRNTILCAQLWLSLGETARARAALSQGATQ